MSAAALASEHGSKRVLFDFVSSEEQKSWRAVNDGVMGGRSQGGPNVNPSDGMLQFSGKLSLENNGGFSSIRTVGREMDLSDYEGIELRFRGEGRKYSFTVATDFRIMAGSYRIELPAAGEEWQTVRLPFDAFEATSFGRRLSRAPILNRKAVRSLGFILADKKAGPFQLEVDSIKAYRSGRSESPERDIVDTAVGAGSFQTLAAALKAAGLVGALKADGPFTVFAPTDAAFAKLPAGTVENLLKPENRESLVAILTFHVVPGRVTSEQVVKLSSAKTLNGKEASIQVDGGKVQVGTATVTQVDVAASNGVIHVIDSVLLPPTAAAAAPASAEVKARRLIEMAIEKGVPLYNHGNEAACAAIYEVAAHGLLAMSADLPGNERWKRMQKGLGELPSEHNMDRRAWSLRHMLDDAYRSLDDN
jgi:uncharacterized surface protein with fasciclin (FAS1) repeats